MAWDTIWKFPIRSDDQWDEVMPAGSVPLSVGVQEAGPVFWAAVDSKAEAQESHRFYLRGTGQPLGHAWKFIGTFQVPGMPLVFHLFDGGPVPE